jgi:hypothetical protein
VVTIYGASSHFLGRIPELSSLTQLSKKLDGLMQRHIAPFATHACGAVALTTGAYRGMPLHHPTLHSSALASITISIRGAQLSRTRSLEHGPLFRCKSPSNLLVSNTLESEAHDAAPSCLSTGRFIRQCYVFRRDIIHHSNCTASLLT